MQADGVKRNGGEGLFLASRLGFVPGGKQEPRCPSREVKAGHKKNCPVDECVSDRGVAFEWRIGDFGKSKIAANRLWLGLSEGWLTKN